MDLSYPVRLRRKMMMSVAARKRSTTSTPTRAVDSMRCRSPYEKTRTLIQSEAGGAYRQCRPRQELIFCRPSNTHQSLVNFPDNMV